MGATIDTRWIAAQVGERRWHCDEVPEYGTQADPAVRRARERTMRRFYAGLLDIPETRTASVTDYGCGPQSLLLDVPGEALAVAVDPLRFTDEDEAAYRDAGIVRVISGAEQYCGHITTEAWMYNCLQHTRDWEQALRTACRHTAETFRLFEWVEVPTDALHLHTLHDAELRRVLHAEGFREIGVTMGEFGRGLALPTAFYAGLWQRHDD